MRPGLLLAFLFGGAMSAIAAPGACPGKLAAYDGYSIAKVDFRNPIGFLTPWKTAAGGVDAAVKVKAGASFSHDALNDDTEALNAALTRTFPSVAEKVKVAYAAGDIRDCDPAAKTLRVLFTIFTSTGIALNPPTIEEQAKETAEPGTTGAVRASANSLLIAPTSSYNQTTGLTGGVRFREVYGKFQLTGDSQVSANSTTDHAAISGTAGSRAIWAGTFSYTDKPVGATRYEEAKLSARVSGMTAERGAARVVLRYGGSLEGGHQQTTAGAGNSRSGAVKVYAGLTGRPGNAAWSGSYGYEAGGFGAGSTFAGAPVFGKHLLDLGYNRSFPFPARRPLGDAEDFHGPLHGGLHRSLSLESRLTGGLIANAAGTPLAERFFGGNAVRPFVDDSSWVMQSDALIRSVPENQLGGAGGSRFYSGNATLAWTAWGRPLLPKELAEGDARFPGVLNIPFHTAAEAIANRNKMQDPAYAPIAATLHVKAGELGRLLSDFAGLLREVPADTAGLRALRSTVTQARGAVSLLGEKVDPQVVQGLTTDQLPKIATAGRSVAALVEAPLAARMEERIGQIAAKGAEMAGVDTLPSAGYMAQAWKTLAPGHRALDVFLNELNVYSIAPVGIFDVARVWPTGEGIHYGLGGGLRLSVLNVNFTVGYAANPQRLAREKAGAVFFNLSVAGLF